MTRVEEGEQRRRRDLLRPRDNGRGVRYVLGISWVIAVLIIGAIGLTFAL